jgi:hypothetical protein
MKFTTSWVISLYTKQDEQDFYEKGSQHPQRVRNAVEGCDFLRQSLPRLLGEGLGVNNRGEITV